jgi:hypothetical protein
MSDPRRLAADERQRRMLAETERLAKAFGWRIRPEATR